ncbi:hypothetical protein KIN20_026944 [Parelaphostrongylus tenuis]|uniref:Uncharacterized protein n=1 Tax=Parelaphostrongylus tenuis TaxID=148309 RepID=A0AAD5QYP1_PARTN|nr:hypothetical protein KIN20_026944 [Parelaphostrongylus tenuis]
MAIIEHAECEGVQTCLKRKSVDTEVWSSPSLLLKTGSVDSDVFVDEDQSRLSRLLRTSVGSLWSVLTAISSYPVETSELRASLEIFASVS